MKLRALNSEDTQYLKLLEMINKVIPVEYHDSFDEMLKLVEAEGANVESSAFVFNLDDEKKKIEKFIKKARKKASSTAIFVKCNELLKDQLVKHQNSKFGADLYLKTPVDFDFVRLLLDQFFNLGLAEEDRKKFSQQEILEAHKEKTVVGFSAQNASDKLDSIFSEVFPKAYEVAAHMTQAFEQDDTDVSLSENIDAALSSVEQEVYELSQPDISIDEFDIGADNDVEEEHQEVDLSEELDEESEKVMEEKKEDELVLSLGSGVDELVDDSLSLELEESAGEADSSDLELSPDEADSLDLEIEGSNDLGIELGGSEELSGVKLELDSSEFSASELDLELSSSEASSLDLDLGDNGAINLELGDSDDVTDLEIDNIEETSSSEEVILNLDEEVEEVDLQFGEETNPNLSFGNDEVSELKLTAELSGSDKEFEMDLGINENIMNELTSDDSPNEKMEEGLDLSLDSGFSLDFGEPVLEELTPENEELTSIKLDFETEQQSEEANLSADDLPGPLTEEEDLRDLFEEKVIKESEEEKNKNQTMSSLSHASDILIPAEPEEETHLFQMPEMSNVEDKKEEVEGISESSEEVIAAESRRYSTNSSPKDEDILRLGETIKTLRSDREELLKRIIDLENEKNNEQRDFIDLHAEIDEKKVELVVLKKRYEKQIDDLKYQLDLSEEKKAYLKQKNTNAAREIEEISRKKHVDINKTRTRERELEDRLEMLKVDAEVQLRNRDHKILELKRRIDTLEFDIENSSMKEKQVVLGKMVLEDKMDQVIATLRGAIGQLEEKEDEDDLKRGNIKKRIDV